MRRLAARWFVPLSLVACGRASNDAVAARQLPPPFPFETAPIPEDAPEVTIGFAWDPPCRVPVYQQRTKKGTTAELTFELAVRSVDGADGPELHVSIEALTFITLNGRPPTASDAALIAGFTTPTMRVSPAGAFIGLTDEERFIEDTAAALRRAGLRNAAQGLRMPQMRAIFEQSAQRYWSMWSESWAGVTAKPGARETSVVEQAVPPLSTEPVPFETTFEHRGAVAGHPDRIVLVATQHAGQAVGDAVAQGLGELAGKPVPADALRDFVLDDVLTAALDPTTGRPERVRFERHVRTRGSDVSDIDEYRFDWAHAVGCGRPAPGAP